MGKVCEKGRQEGGSREGKGRGSPLSRMKSCPPAQRGSRRRPSSIPMDFLCATLPLVAYLSLKRRALRTPTKPRVSSSCSANTFLQQEQHQPSLPPTFTDTSLAALLSLPSALPSFFPAQQLVYVDTLPQLQRLGQALQHATVIGLDVEHSPHSFHGYVCTLQVSLFPAAVVFVLDALVPEVRRGILAALGPALCNPAQLKVLHGGHNDCKWLLSNFGLRVSPLVDTQCLASEVGEGYTSLAELLHKHGGLDLTVERKREYQRGDWRRRPLPVDWLVYAGQDAFYLPFLALKFTTILLAGGATTSAVGGDALSPTALLSPRLEKKCSQIQAHWLDLGAAEVFSPSPLLGKALREVVKWREEPGGGVKMMVVGEGGGLVLGGTSFSTGEVLVLFTYLKALEWRHATALGDDVSQEDDIASRGALLLSCREAVEGRCPTLPLPLGKYTESLARAVTAHLSDALLSHPSHLGRALNAGMMAGAHAYAHTHAQHHQPEAVIKPHHFHASERDRVKQSRASRVFTPRSSPLYSNCELQAPDGTVLARVDKTKAQWYVSKGIAEVVGEGDDSTLVIGGVSGGAPGDSNGPLLRIRMVREPKGKGHAGDDFHLQPRKNVCVVCGVKWEQQQQQSSLDVVRGGAEDGEVSGGNLVRCYVVPRGLRTHLPVAAKSYSNHDVLLTCMACHRRADVAEGALLKRIAMEFGVSLSTSQWAATAAAAAAAAAAASAPSVVAAGDDDEAAAPSSPLPTTLPSHQAFHLYRKVCITLQRWMQGPPTSLPLPRLIELVGVVATGEVVRTAKAIIEGQRGEGGGVGGGHQQSEVKVGHGRGRRKAQTQRLASAAVAAAMGVETESMEGGREGECWQWLLLNLPPPLLSSLQTSGLLPRHITILAHTPAHDAAATAAQLQASSTHHASSFVDSPPLTSSPALEPPPPFPPPPSSRPPSSLTAFEPMTAIMREVYAGGEAWQRVERNYREFTVLDRTASVTGLSVECEQRLERFVKRWRKGFLDFVHPQHLPLAWSVDYNVFATGTKTKDVKEAGLCIEFRATAM